MKGLEGMYVKAEKTEQKIFDILAARDLLLTISPYTHEYPHCWRCVTPVLYYARTSWFVGMSKLKSKLIANNKKINWVPEHVKTGRFGEWLKEAKDWNFSRERYWGTPLPIWECVACGRKEVIESYADIKSKGKKNNTFLFTRHGESDNLIDKICTSMDTGKYTSHLTPKGKETVEERAKKFKKEKIDLIISSPLALYYGEIIQTEEER